MILKNTQKIYKGEDKVSINKANVIIVKIIALNFIKLYDSIISIFLPNLTLSSIFIKYKASFQIIFLEHQAKF